MTDVLLLSAVRTPIGKYLGSLAELPAPSLGALVVAESLRRANAPPHLVDEVIMGMVLQAGAGQNPARQAALRAGLPDSISALTINKVCGSGLEAVMQAARALRADDAQLIVAGGMESMSRAPHLLFGTRAGWKYGDQTARDAMIHDGLWCAFEDRHMGESAEHTARTSHISRPDQDRFAAQSHHRAAAAWDAGAFADEVIPVTVGTGSRAKTLDRDEGLRPDTTIDTLAKLRPAFQESGTVTAGNASTLSDGAAAVVVATPSIAEQLGTPPLARVVSWATAGVHPRDIFLAPIFAVRKALERARLNISEIGLFELNEAFAAQMLADARELGLDEARVNVHGGAIALGHPIGASGTRVLVTLLHALKRQGQRYGLASLCLGGGNAVALVVERL